jgi:hypothetical protein
MNEYERRKNATTDMLVENEHSSFGQIQIDTITNVYLAEQSMEENYAPVQDDVDLVSVFGVGQAAGQSYVAPIQGFGLSRSRSAKGYFDNPYSGRKLDISDELSANIQDGFGIDTSKLSLLESPDVAEFGAIATAQGNVIRFAPRYYQPDTMVGLKILGHELNHVRDQALGKVHANIEGTNINLDSAFESSSDYAGDAFASGILNNASPVLISDNSATSAPVQGFFSGRANAHIPNPTAPTMLRTCNPTHAPISTSVAPTMIRPPSPNPVPAPQPPDTPSSQPITNAPAMIRPPNLAPAPQPFDVYRYHIMSMLNDANEITIEDITNSQWAAPEGRQWNESLLEH